MRKAQEPGLQCSHRKGRTWRVAGWRPVPARLLPGPSEGLVPDLSLGLLRGSEPRTPSAMKDRLEQRGTRALSGAGGAGEGRGGSESSKNEAPSVQPCGLCPLSYEKFQRNPWSLVGSFQGLCSLGCCDRTPQTGWLKQQTFISHGSSGWEAQAPGGSQSHIW